MKSLALASKVKSLALASRPQVLENWPVLGSRTAVFFELLKFCGALEKFFGKLFRGDRLKNFCEDLFLLESTCACVLGPWLWPRAFLSLASRGSVLEKAVLGLGLGFFLCPWPWPRALCPRLHVCYQVVLHCLQLFFKQTFISSQGGISDKVKCTSAFRLCNI